MKLAELIQEHDLQLQAEDALKQVDWSFDVDPFQAKRFARGEKIMMNAEQAVNELYQISPGKAIELWCSYCPWAVPGSMPAVVLRQ